MENIDIPVRQRNHTILNPLNRSLNNIGEILSGVRRLLDWNGDQRITNPGTADSTKSSCRQPVNSVIFVIGIGDKCSSQVSFPVFNWEGSLKFCEDIFLDAPLIGKGVILGYILWCRLWTQHLSRCCVHHFSFQNYFTCQINVSKISKSYIHLRPVDPS